jgi:membrane protease YdiL (CAAX protease family)
LLPLILSLILDLFLLLVFWSFGQYPPLYLIYPIDHLFAVIIPISLYLIYNFYNDKKSNVNLFKSQFSSINETLKAFSATFPFLILSLILYNYSGRIVANPLDKHTIILFFYVIVFGPITEEFLFRGIILKKLLEHKLAVITSILIVSILETSAHILMSHLLIYLFFIFISDILFSISYLKGKLGASLLNHVLMNFVVFIFFTL